MLRSRAQLFRRQVRVHIRLCFGRLLLIRIRLKDLLKQPTQTFPPRTGFPVSAQLINLINQFLRQFQADALAAHRAVLF